MESVRNNDELRGHDTKSGILSPESVNKYMPENKILSDKFKREYIERYGDSVIPKDAIIKPSRVDIEKRISEIENLDLKCSDVDYVKDKLVLIFQGYSIVTPFFPAGFKIYRGRSFTDKPFNVSQLLYPPSGHINTWQRVNRPGESMFYCSYARSAVFFELDLTGGDHVAIATWRTKSDLLVNNVGYTERCFKNKKSNRECPKWCNDVETSSDNIIDKDINEFLSRSFIKRAPAGEEYQYKLSIAISEKMLNHEMFGGLIYPSIAMRANADNIALRPSYVDNHLVIEQVEYIRVDERKDEMTYEVTVLDYANSFDIDGNIEWKGRRPQWVIRENGGQLIMTVENGRWVARNVRGQIVEPE